MKFKHELEEEMRVMPNWAYVSYRSLEAMTKKYKYEREEAAVVERNSADRLAELREDFFEAIRQDIAVVDGDFTKNLELCKRQLEYLHTSIKTEASSKSRTVSIEVDHVTGLSPDLHMSHHEIMSRMKSLEALYVDLLDLNRMRTVNREAFRKIVKKFDKASGEKNQSEFMKTEIDVRNFAKDDVVKATEEGLLRCARLLFADTETGDRMFSKFCEDALDVRKARRKKVKAQATVAGVRMFLKYAAAYAAVFLFLSFVVRPHFSAVPEKNWQGYVVIFGIVTGVLLIAIFSKPADVTLMSVDILFLATGIISSREAFAGFSNEGVIANGILLPFARALSLAGGAELCLISALGQPRNLQMAQLRMSLVVATLSSVLNNTPIVFMMIPILQVWCSRLNMSVSKFMMPMSFAIMLGGTCSIVGSSANLVTIGIAGSYHGKYAAGHQPEFLRPGFFQPAIIGIPVCLVGCLWMVFSSPFLLPARIPAAGDSGSSSLGGSGSMSMARMMHTPGVFASQARFDVPFKILKAMWGMTVESTGITRLGPEVLYIVNTNEIKGENHEPPDYGSWEYRIKEGDVAVFRCSAQQVSKVRQSQALEIYNKHVAKLTGERRERGLVEGVVGSESPLVGKSLVDLDLRREHNACCIAIHRDRAPKSKLGGFKRWELQEGDVLLLEANKREALVTWPKLGWFTSIVAVENSAPPMRDFTNMVITMGALLLLVILTSLSIIDIVTLGFIVVAVFLALKVITTKEAWGSVKGDVLLTIAASFGIGQAMANSGLAMWIGNIITSLTAGNELAVLSLVYLFTVTLGMVLNNAAVAVLVYPVAYSAAVENAGLDPELVVFLIIMGAGLSFTTPMSYQTNQMVQAPGGYHFSDYVRFGGALQVVSGVASVVFLYLLAVGGFIKRHHALWQP
ncbi:putative sulfur deprivation response regulator [Diplonema papillatum]|nr:putative sulfur deprivation response regulator [Diplonema papillatum]